MKLFLLTIIGALLWVVILFPFYQRPLVCVGAAVSIPAIYAAALHQPKKRNRKRRHFHGTLPPNFRP